MSFHIISLGHNCQPDAAIRRFFSKSVRFPFDEVSTPTLRGLMPFLLGGMEGFLAESFPDILLPRLSPDIQPTTNGPCRFPHHSFSAGDPGRVANVASFGRRIIRLLNVLHSGERVVLVRNARTAGFEDDQRCAEEFLEQLREVYRNPLLELKVFHVPRGVPEKEWENFEGWREAFVREGLLSEPDDPA